MLPLQGILVLDLAQYLAGPSATLRLADFGARVIKVERPGVGDGSRQLMLGDLRLDGDSLLFHTINRGKESVAANLSDEGDRTRLLDLVRRADVLVHSFRPGALARHGFDYAALAEINPRLVYAHVTGYGDDGPWRLLPGQDLLVQARTGLVWLNGTADDPPEPLGLSVVDQLAGAYLAQGVLACLVRRGVTGRGGFVEVSLLEAAMDLQFEVFTTYLGGGGTPRRSAVSAAHPYIGAPYGIYATSDGWLALAMGSLRQLGELVGVPDLADGADRDATKRRLVKVLRERSTADWLGILEPAGYWCAEVRDWPALEKSGALDALQMVVECGSDARAFRTTRCPVRIDGQPLAATAAAPRLDEHAPLPDA
ncbi:MAG TPA: CaiB/BaiF CoA-transferase family protein [Actinopolymorphaceae bacterium]|jgi:crotonobetainyl-CoA:carnitine CoA-transferase CaiB-like acyl-CoA transferase|nr:CaiB/BaiF CoA-transferase family protein [Actinopolymorphaceae bacterium]